MEEEMTITPAVLLIMLDTLYQAAWRNTLKALNRELTPRERTQATIRALQYWPMVQDIADQVYCEVRSAATDDE